MLIRQSGQENRRRIIDQDVTALSQISGQLAGKIGIAGLGQAVIVQEVGIRQDPIGQAFKLAVPEQGPLGDANQGRAAIRQHHPLRRIKPGHAVQETVNFKTFPRRRADRHHGRREIGRPRRFMLT